MKIKALIILLFCVFLAAASFAVSIFDWQYYESDNFLVFYPKGYERQAQETLFYLEKYLPSVKKITGNTDKIKIRVLIEDAGIYANASASQVMEKIGLFTSPIDLNYELIQNSMARSNSIHEQTHTNQLLNNSGLGKLGVTIFGYSLSPNNITPYWIVEGITVYNDSQISTFEGRLNLGYYDAFIAACAKSDKMPSVSQAAYLYARYPLRSYPYLYGANFFNYLAKTYGPEKFGEFFKLYSYYVWAHYLGEFFPAAALDHAASKVYGKTFPELFSDWEKYEKKRHAQWELAGQIAEQAKKYSRSYSLTVGNGKLYFFRRHLLYHEAFSYRYLYDLVEYDPQTGQEETLEQFTAKPSNYAQILGGKAYYALQDSVPGYANVGSQGRGAILCLYAYDFEAKKSKELFSDEFYSFAVFNPEKIFYAKARKKDYGAEIWEYDGKARKKIGEIDETILQMIPYQNKIIVTSQKNLGSHNISILDPDNLALTPLIDTVYPELKIKLAGNYLYYTGLYNGRVFTYKYDLLTKKVWKVSPGSFADDGVVLDRKLYFIGISSEGEYVYQGPLAEEEVSLPEKEVIQEEPVVFNKEIKEGPALIKNLGYLLLPYNRFHNALFIGSDGIGYNYYRFNYTSSRGIDFYLSSSLLLPLEINYANIALSSSRRYDALSLSYPVYKSSRKGLTSLTLTYDINSLGSSSPGLSIGLAGPRYRNTIALETDPSTSGANVSIHQSYLFDAGKLDLDLTGFKDYTKVWSFRGRSATAAYAEKGAQLDCQYSQRLFEIRNGFWNPNIFFGDLYGGPFVELLSSDVYNFSAWGFELTLEGNTKFWSTFEPTLGVSIRPGDNITYFSLDFPLY